MLIAFAVDVRGSWIVARCLLTVVSGIVVCCVFLFALCARCRVLVVVW